MMMRSFTIINIPYSRRKVFFSGILGVNEDMIILRAIDTVMASCQIFTIISLECPASIHGNRGP
jgi:hypothetical protein